MKKYFIFFLYFCFLNLKILCINYPSAGSGFADKYINIYTSRLQLNGAASGSEDNVGTNSSSEEPTSASNALGLVWCMGGISIGGTERYVRFASPLPLGKELALSDVVFVVLMEDVHFSSSVNLISSGKIEAKYGSMNLNGPFNLLGNRLTFVDTGYIPNFNGKGNILDFSNGGQIVVDAPNRMEFNNIYLKNLKNNSITFNNPSSSVLTFTDSIIKLDGNVCFNQDVSVQSGELLISGTGHAICFNRKLEVKNGARLKMDYGTTFSLGYHGYIQTNGTGSFHFNGCNIEIGENYGLGAEINNGFNLKNGFVLFENRVTINDDNKYKHFIIGSNSDSFVLSKARVVLEGTTTFSVL